MVKSKTPAEWRTENVRLDKNSKLNYCLQYKHLKYDLYYLSYRSIKSNMIELDYPIKNQKDYDSYIIILSGI